MSAALRVTFVGHDASRTGAPTVLRSFLRWLAISSTTQTHLVLLDGGPLQRDYERLTPTITLSNPMVRLRRNVSHGLRAAGLPVPARNEALPRRHLRDADVIVVNTLAALGPVATARRGSTPLVCHVHELDGVADRVLPPTGSARDQLLDEVSLFVAAGTAVERMLVERCGISSSRVVVIDEFIDVPTTAPIDPRDALGIPATTPLVAALGMAGPRKGSDYFVDLMAQLRHHRTAPVGIWVGGEEHGTAFAEAAFDIAAGGLDRSVRFLPTTAQPLALIAAAEVFVTTAREDPFPLAVLEAGALGLPVAGFASGGTEYLLERAGLGNLVVPIGDVMALHECVSELLDAPTQRRDLGDGLAAWVRGTHLTKHLAPALLAAIEGAA